MKTLLSLLIAVVFCPVLSWAASLTTVDCNSSTAGVQVVSSIGGGVTITVPSGAASAVWLAKVDGTCSTAMTSVGGYRITAGNGWDFTPRADDGYFGQICCLRESSSGTINVTVNAR